MNDCALKDVLVRRSCTASQALVRPVIHTASVIELSSDLPVVIEVVDDQAHVDRLLPILDEMITGGALVTVEQVRVVRYAAGDSRRTSDS